MADSEEVRRFFSEVEKTPAPAPAAVETAENPEIPGHVGETTATLEISKKALTVSAGDFEVAKIYDGTTSAGAVSGSLALEGVVGDDEVAIDMTNISVADYA